MPLSFGIIYFVLKLNDLLDSHSTLGTKAINIYASSLAGTFPVASPLPSLAQEHTISTAICAIETPSRV